MKRNKLFLVFLLCCCSIVVQGQSKDSLKVMRAAQTFIRAFTAFDWNKFRNCFTDDATIFFPAWEEGYRRVGRREFESTWIELFPEFIDSTKKFVLKIEPQDINIQMYNHSAIVTFHLGKQTKYLSRRTLIFIRKKEAWKIAHLHASTLMVPEK